MRIIVLLVVFAKAIITVTYSLGYQLEQTLDPNFFMLLTWVLHQIVQHVKKRCALQIVIKGGICCYTKQPAT